MRLLNTFLLLATFLIAFQTSSQSTPNQSSSWLEEMQQGSGNLNQISADFEQFWQNKTIEKGSGYKPFKRWEWRMQKRVDDQGNLPAKDAVFNEISNLQTLKSTAGNWKQLGPNYNQTTQIGSIAGVGRLNTIEFHPTDPNILYAGAPAGGLWISYDNGASWENKTDGLPTLGVSAILVNPNDPNHITIGTGDRDADDAEGLGVFISNDGGNSWNQSNTGMGNIRVNVMQYHPNPDSTNIMFAGCQGGFYRSTDSGINWSKIILSNSNFEDFEIHPSEENIMYAVGSSRIYRTEDFGYNWTPVSGLPLVNRLFITVSADEPDRVYALLCNQRSLYGFYRSDDKGQTFNLIMNTKNIMGYQADGSDLTGGQAWYDACMVADPNDGDVIYVAGIRVHKSTDGGLTWSHNSAGVHVDMHYLDISPLTDEIYLCNDGGLYRSDAGNSGWTDISSTMVIGQMYKLGQSPSDVNTVLCGFQDNGTAAFNGTGWNRFTGGDGMECQVDPIDGNYWYSTYQYGTILRSINGGVSAQSIGGSGINNINEDGAWVTPYKIAEHNNAMMYAGYQNIWRTDKLKESNKNDVLWEKISTGLGSSSDEFSVVEHSPLDSNLLYTYKNGSFIYRSDNCNDPAASVSWSSTSVIGGSGNINDIECSPHVTDDVYIVRGNFVLKSTDRGNSWTDISGTLPSITKTCITYDTTSNEGLYVGTVAGIYYKDATMTDWVYFGAGMPAAIEVTEINIHYTATGIGRVRASTYGRGLWESDGYNIITTNFPTTALLNFATDNPKKETYGDIILTVDFYKNLSAQSVTGFDASDVNITNATVSSITPNGDSYDMTLSPIAPGVVTVQIINNAATDTDGILSIESDLLELNYVDQIINLGHEGPGGVGYLSELAIWLDADKGLVSSTGGSPTNSGEALSVWEDQSAQNVLIDQTIGSQLPYALIGNDGISGLNAVGFSPDTVSGLGDYFYAQDVNVGQNFAGFWAAQSNTDPYNTHGWLASARQANGFIMHPNQNDQSIYGVIIDKNNGYWFTNTLGSFDPSEPHIHSFAYCESDIARYAISSVDGMDAENSAYTVPGRTDSALINIKYGWDINSRFGDGKIGEHFIYNTRIGKSHYNIIRNYLGNKFQIDMTNNDLYAYDAEFKHNLAGIGRENAQDRHLNAQGSGIIRMSIPSIDTDGSYLLWADNDGDLTWLSSSFSPFETQRVIRTWQVDETNTVGTISAHIAASSLPSYSDQIGIIVSSTPDFTTSSKVYQLSEVAADSLSAQIDFAKGQYFTLLRGSQEDFDFINESYSGLSISAYPSPNNGTFDIYVRNDTDVEGTLSIYDAAGRRVYNEVLNGAKTVLVSMANLSAGTYTIRYDDNAENVTTRVVVVD